MGASSRSCSMGFSCAVSESRPRSSPPLRCWPRPPGASSLARLTSSMEGSPLPESGSHTHSVEGLTWTDVPLWDQFQALADDDPQALAIVAADGRPWTRGEMHAVAIAALGALRAAGVQAHDRVMLQGRKTPQTLACALGISAARAIICPYTPDLGAAERQVLDERLGHIAVVNDSEGVP